VVIAGVDNANLKDLDHYVGNTRSMEWACIGCNQKYCNLGDVRLTVSSPRLTDAEIIIEAGPIGQISNQSLSQSLV
jgi:hypothetical protein